MIHHILHYTNEISLQTICDSLKAFAGDAHSKQASVALLCHLLLTMTDDAEIDDTIVPEVLPAAIATLRELGSDIGSRESYCLNTATDEEVLKNASNIVLHYALFQWIACKYLSYQHTAVITSMRRVPTTCQ
jgi:hypothetical protein